jgi:hypothetical protein
MAPYQIDALFHEGRYGLVEGSTKSGKTAPCLVWLAEQAMAGKPGRNYWWVAPVYTQAEIAYRRMKRGLPREFWKSNDSERRIELANGTFMWFKSGEKPDNLYGEDVYAAVIDEASRVREDSWIALRSTLTATKGPVRIIGNVKGRTNWFYKMARLAERGEPGMRYRKVTAMDAVAAGVLDAEEIEDARRRLPDSVFQELYMAEAADLAGRVYKSYAPENVSADIQDLDGTLLVGMDFNVDPMTACLASKAGDELHIWDEIVIRNGNTEEMAEEIRRRYPDRDIAVYPDPSGKARKTSAPVGQTDFTILKAHGMRLVAPNAAPAVVDRVNEVNALLCNTEGRRRLLVHPRCEALIECFEGLIYKVLQSGESTGQPDKSLNIDHIGDACGYLVHMEFPIIGRAKVKTHRLKGF